VLQSELDGNGDGRSGDVGISFEDSRRGDEVRESHLESKCILSSSTHDC